MLLSLSANDWTFWEEYAPSVYYGSQRVTFDGPNQLILINENETAVDFGIDVYSGWKEWMNEPWHENGKYAEAISVVGGDPLPGDRQLGTTYFLENGWKMRTWEGTHILTVSGNVFSRDGLDPFVDTLTDVKVTVNMNTSTLVETIETGILLGLDAAVAIDEVWKLHGLDQENDLVVTAASRTAGAAIQQTIVDDGEGTVTVSRD